MVSGNGYLGLNLLISREALVEKNKLSETDANAVFARVQPLQYAEDGTALYLESIVDRAIEDVLVEKYRPSSRPGAFFSDKENPKWERGGVGQPLMKTKEAAMYLAISTRQVQYEVGRGNIAVIQIGKSCTRFAKEDLDAFVQSKRKPSRREGGQEWQA